MKLVLALLLSCGVCLAAIDQNGLPEFGFENKEASSADPKPCCLPKRWRGKFGEMVGVMVGPHSGVAGAAAEVFTDMGVGKVAVHEFVAAGRRHMNITAVADYNKQEMYVVTSRRPSKCYKKKLPKSTKSQCLPKTAKFTGSMTFGMGSNALKANAFQVTMHKKMMDVFMSITVTSKNCVPFGVSGFSRVGHVKKMFTGGYFDLFSDIPDPKVFDPPKVCQNATMFDTEYELSDLQHYLFNVHFTM